MSVYLYTGFFEEYQETIYCNSDPVQPSDTDLPLYSCVTQADWWSTWLVGFLKDSTWKITDSHWQYNHFLSHLMGKVQTFAKSLFC